jgi:hypothetical protein
MVGEYDLTAISYHAYPYVADKYQLMASGSSIGDGYGPMVVTTTPISVEELKGKRIAVPGKMTTAYLTMRIMQPDFEAVVVPFDKILDAVTEGSADAGLVIHEAQLTYGRGGFHKIVDLRFAASPGCQCNPSRPACQHQERMLPPDARQHPVRPRSSGRSTQLRHAVCSRYGAAAG